jgi:hypothetical protein
MKLRNAKHEVNYRPNVLVRRAVFLEHQIGELLQHAHLLLRQRRHLGAGQRQREPSVGSDGDGCRRKRHADGGNGMPPPSHCSLALLRCSETIREKFPGRFKDRKLFFLKLGGLGNDGINAFLRLQIGETCKCRDFWGHPDCFLGRLTCTRREVHEPRPWRKRNLQQLDANATGMQKLGLWDQATAVERERETEERVNRREVGARTRCQI